MAALCDSNSECSELAHEILLKYTIEKNTVFMRSCLLECPFVLNGYVYLDNLEMFADGDADLNSPMQGAEHRAARQYVYRFFIHNISVEHCYAYFGNLHMFMDKLTHEAETMTRPEGLAAVLDFLYVLTHICRAKEKNKRKMTADNTEDGDEDAGPARAAEDAPKDLPATSAAVGRGRKGNVGLTVDQALHIVEKAIPRIAELNVKLHAIDPTLCSSVEDLAEEMTLHFADLTEYAQPQSFWKKFNPKKVPLKPSKTRPIVYSEPGSSSSSSDGEEETSYHKNRSDEPVASTSFARPTRPVRQSHKDHRLVAESPSQSESESDVDRRNARLSRKRFNK